MRRRIFAFALASLVLATFHLAPAQQPRKIARIGYLSPGDLVGRAYRIDAFRKGLKDLGYIEGRNIVIEYRLAEANAERLPELARELVALKVDVIFAGGGPATEAARNATQTIPIVTSSQDPVGEGFVAGLPRPGGNITGVVNLTSELIGKRLELLKEVIPHLSRVAVLRDPSLTFAPIAWKRTEVSAQALGMQLQSVELRNRDDGLEIKIGKAVFKDLESALAAIKKEGAEALFMIRGPIMNALTKRIANLTVETRLPAIYDEKRFPELGGLISYGTDLADVDRRAAMYIDRILKGAKPADLPVEQPSKFELVINLKTAKQIGLTIRQPVLYRADTVIK